MRPLVQDDGRAVHDVPAARSRPQLPGVVGSGVQDVALGRTGGVVAARDDRAEGALATCGIGPGLDREGGRVERCQVGNVHVLVDSVVGDGGVRVAGRARRGRRMRACSGTSQCGCCRRRRLPSFPRLRRGASRRAGSRRGPHRCSPLRPTAGCTSRCTWRTRSPRSCVSGRHRPTSSRTRTSCRSGPAATAR